MITPPPIPRNPERPAITSPTPDTQNQPPQPTHDVFVNGQMLPPDQATVSATDAGFQHAVGLFETFQCYQGRPFRLQQHLDRLANSARELGLAESIDTAPLAQAVTQTIAHNHLDRARLRLTLTAGTISMLQRDPESNDAPEVQVRRTIVITPTPPTVYDPGYFESGVTVRLHGPAASPFDITAGHKTLNYWARLRSLRLAATVGAAETIWLNVTNHLACGAVSNVFIVKDGELLTPFARGEETAEALPAPVLPGITRAAIIELAQAEGIKATRRMLSVDELLDADEAFLTNSGWGVLPIANVEQKQIGQGVGPVTRKMIDGLQNLINEENHSA